MTRAEINELNTLCQQLYKRIIEWWVASLQGEPKRVSSKRTAVKVLVDKIHARLTVMLGPAEAGWFLRSKAAELIRARVADCKDGNWINEAWHRKDRLEQILVRAERGLGACAATPEAKKSALTLRRLTAVARK